MSSNYDRDEILVYIRRTTDAPRSKGGVIGDWEYYQMASLPTNDNPRYSVGNNNINQDIISSYYFKIKTGPSDIKVQVGPYPQVSGGVDQNNEIIYVSPKIIAEVKLKDQSSGVFYHVLNTTTGILEDEIYTNIPFRYYKLGTPPESYFPYIASDLIHTTGDISIRFKMYDENALGPLDAEFDTLSDVPLYSGIPKILPQTGVMVLKSNFVDEEVREFFELSYPESYTYMTINSLEINDINNIKLTPSALSFSNPYPNKPLIVDSGVITSLNGVYPPWGRTAYHELQLRREAGTQLHKIPLHEITNDTKRVGCAATHVAYKVGHVDRSASDQYFSTPIKATPETDHKILYTPRPAVYLFINSTNFYTRLPECWPWSCRRWTVEKKLDDTKKYVKFNYFTHDANGNKISTTYSNLPVITVDFSSFTGETGVKTPRICNVDPLSNDTVVDTLGNDNKIPLIPSNADNFFNGYYYSKIPISIDSTETLLQCGCKEDDQKVELAVELFPYLDRPTCTFIMKLGYLCYPTKNCTIPNIGEANKKIIHPFNSCKFNEILDLPLKKMTFPSIDITSYSMIFGESPKAILSYVISETDKPPILSDPYEHPNAKVIPLEAGNEINLENKDGYISMSVRFPCKRTSDIYTYKVTPEYIASDPSFVTPLNAVHDCPTEYLGRVSIVGNGTDVPEYTGNIITGGDYYYDGSTRVFWNRSDLPKLSEVYKTEALGNIQGFLNRQSSCCEYCQEADENKDVWYFPDPNCFRLDIEPTPSSISQYEEAGDCKINTRKPCDNTVLNGRANLRVYTTFKGNPAANADFDVLTVVSGTPIIKVHISGVLSSSGCVPEPTGLVRVTGKATFDVISHLQDIEGTIIL